VKMMAGEELSSTDLNLANGDTLLVGQVAEVEQVDSLDASAANRPYYRKLQVTSRQKIPKIPNSWDVYLNCKALEPVEPV